MKSYNFLPFIFLLLCPLALMAQIDTTVNHNHNIKPVEQVSDSLKPIDKFSTMTAADLMSIELPPLSVLLENAKQSPVTAALMAQMEQYQQELKIQKKSWLQHIRVYSTYQYGTMTMLSFEYPSPSGIYVGNDQSMYSVGASLSIPLDEFFTRGNKIKKQQIAVKQAEYEVERWFEELSLNIIEEYTNVLQFLSQLKVQTEDAAMARAQYTISESNFINGKMDIQTLSRFKTDVSTAVTRYENTYNNLLKAVLRLEILSQTKIISK